MTIPRAPLLLGLAGLIPFFWGAATLSTPVLAEWAVRNIGPLFAGPFVMLQYGTIILAFMSGVLLTVVVVSCLSLLVLG